MTVSYICACAAAPLPAAENGGDFTAAPKKPPIDKTACGGLFAAYDGIITQPAFFDAGMAKWQFKERVNRSRNQKKTRTLADDSVHGRMKLGEAPASNDEGMTIFFLTAARSKTFISSMLRSHAAYHDVCRGRGRKVGQRVVSQGEKVGGVREKGGG